MKIISPPQTTHPRTCDPAGRQNHWQHRYEEVWMPGYKMSMQEPGHPKGGNWVQDRGG